MNANDDCVFEFNFSSIFESSKGTFILQERPYPYYFNVYYNIIVELFFKKNKNTDNVCVVPTSSVFYNKLYLPFKYSFSEFYYGA